MDILEIYDNGGDTIDRYTVVFNYFETPESLACLCLSDNPTHPQGYSMFAYCHVGGHLGKRVKFSDLPENIQNHIDSRSESAKVADLSPYKQAICEFLEESEKSLDHYPSDTSEAFQEFFSDLSVYQEYDARDNGESVEDYKAELYVAFVQLCEGV